MRTSSLAGVLLIAGAIAGPVCGQDAKAKLRGDVAEVNGVAVTREEFELKNSTRLFQARNSFYEAEKKALDEYINDRLVQEQARKEGLTVAALFEKHVTKALPPDPADDALKVYYEGLDSKEPFDVMKAKIRDHIRQKRLERVKTAYIESLRQGAAIAVKLDPPRMIVPTDGFPVRGSRDAPVMIVEYADYECPFCQQIEPALEQVLQTFADKVAFVYKDVPLPMHANAQKAAEAKLCAGAQGKYWEFHDLLVGSKELQLPSLKERARKLNLDTAKFDQCLDSGAQAPPVQASITEAQNVGVQGTPSFLINGRFYSGVLTFDALRQVIDEELGAPSQKDKVARR
ncbi:MAG: thioredoxin domain-containing protein [Bryobacterales bacterium]|nr:thioredoxin domain-containing protein [Bryobacterales bacterium]